MNIIYTAPICLVCGKDGHGTHFGVVTCRACAMFFRRSDYRKEEYICRNTISEKCDLSKPFPCKYCRLKKCEKLGMKLDLMGTVVTVPTVPPKIRKMKKSEKRVSYPIIHPLTQKLSEWINIDPLISRSRKILEELNPPSTSQLEPLNALQKMKYALDKLRSGQSKNPKFEKFMNFDDYFTHWEELMTRTAQWLMHSKQFIQLPSHERVSIFKIVWSVWRRFERHSLSAKVFGEKCVEEKLLLMSDDVAQKVTCNETDSNGLEMDLKTVNGFVRFRNAVRKNLIQYFEIVSRPCIEWEFTEMEINYALCQIIWIYSSRKLLGQTLQAADSFLFEISENLHDYYRNEMKLKNYAPRLAVLMEMVSNVLKIQAEHEKVMEMILLFDSFGCIFSEPQFFCV